MSSKTKNMARAINRADRICVAITVTLDGAKSPNLTKMVVNQR